MRRNSTCSYLVRINTPGFVRMARITSWVDLDCVWENSGHETRQDQQTSFAVVDNSETFFYGSLKLPRDKITLEQLNSALKRVPDNDVYSNWPVPGMELTQAQDFPMENVYVKHPCPQMYEVLKGHEQLSQMPERLLPEAEILELLARAPHPNIVRYYGCRVARGFLTGLVMDRHSHDLENYIKKESGNIDQNAFMIALESSIHHLHSLGLAHNDLTPSNILVSERHMPILIDFNGCQPFGTPLKYIRGTPGWIDGKIEDYSISDKNHDLSALVKIKEWLEDSVVEK
jgi:serine/threonine protein kinase